MRSPLSQHTRSNINRRQFCAAALTGVAIPALCGTGLTVAANEPAATPKDFKLNYLVASSMYGKLPLADVLAQVRKTGATAIDIWRNPHADQREQIQMMGDEAFAKLLEQHKVTLKATTIWGKPFAEEIKFLKRHGGDLIITGFVPKDNAKAFLEKLKPQLANAEEAGITVAIENHGAGFDAIRAFAEAIQSPAVKIALAPYHLPDDAPAMAKLIEDLGPKLGLFYAWQHGMGAMKKLPKEQELMQMPGRGKLDFAPLLAALRKIRFDGPTEIFMHPVPRGIPILETAELVTQEINRAAQYLADCMK